MWVGIPPSGIPRVGVPPCGTLRRNRVSICIVTAADFYPRVGTGSVVLRRSWAPVSDPSVALGIRISITQMTASHTQMGGLRAGEAQQGPDGPYSGDNLGSTDTPFGAAPRQPKLQAPCQGWSAGLQTPHQPLHLPHRARWLPGMRRGGLHGISSHSARERPAARGTGHEPLGLCNSVGRDSGHINHTCIACTHADRTCTAKPLPMTATVRPQLTHAYA